MSSTLNSDFLKESIFLNNLWPKKELFEFLSGTDYICGHNIIHHDAKYLFTDKTCQWILVDTLYLSPLLFPERPYHKRVKDDKLISDQMNNPVNDCEKAKALRLDEIARWHSLPDAKRRLFASLLKDRNCLLYTSCVSVRLMISACKRNLQCRKEKFLERLTVCSLSLIHI